MRSLTIPLTILLVLLIVPAARTEKPPEEPLADQVRLAIQKGVKYLLHRQARDGHWEVDVGAIAIANQGGWTSLTLLALLQGGVSPRDPAIQKGLAWLRTIPAENTYVVGLQTMVYALVGEARDRERLERNVQWLIKARRMANADTLRGWTYRAVDKRALRSDNSNTQYALLGLHEAHLAQVPIQPDVWGSVRSYYLRTQHADGSWSYQTPPTADAANGPNRSFSGTLTMTVAGLCGLLIAGMDHNQGRETLFPDGTGADRCGQYEENRAITKALDWIAGHFPSADQLQNEPNLYYLLYGIERAGRLTGRRYFGNHDWYRTGCQFLVRKQRAEGNWQGRDVTGSPILATSFALLFLSKGRTPVLISKLTHRGSDGQGGVNPEDWNLDRNDVRHLVDYASQHLFRRQPLAWQIFNAEQVEAGSEEVLAAELLQSPIAYLNGHLKPDFADSRMKEVLRKYVENGGFILAEACCGDKRFDQGFRELMEEIFGPDSPLQPLPPTHPIWLGTGKYPPILPEKPFKLYGIQRGCKTVVVYSPQDLSCSWEAGPLKPTKTPLEKHRELAFQLGTNIIAYATGMEPPRPRLTTIEVLPDDTTPRKRPRGFLKVAQLRHDGDWQPAPRAVHNLMHELRTKSGLDVVLQPDEVRPDSARVNDYKFLYLHGRHAFAFRKDKLDHLRYNLEHRGLLFADACCGSKKFDEAFRKFISDLWPDKKLEPIPLNDDLFSKDLNGTAITKVRCRRPVADGGLLTQEFRVIDPFLEGIRIGDRWAVIYSKFDIGCALQKHQSIDCMGHDYASAVLIGKAAVLYYLMR